MQSKKLYIKTYGCQMNVYDSDRMTDILSNLGYSLTSSMDKADLVVVNTCHVREKATEKVFSDLGRIKPLKERAEREEGRLMMVAVTGCTAQAEGEEIIKRASFVDLVVGSQAYHQLPQLIAQAHRARGKEINGPGRGIVATDFPIESKFDHLPERGAQGATAFVAIQEGCDKFCHFCIVPYTRGAEYSRTVDEVIKEVKDLVDQGVREVTLLGQNVNAYHGKGPDGKEWPLGRLIEALADLKDLWRIRYTTSHPRDVDDSLIEAHASVTKLMPLLHLPVQSGSDRILKAMNRKHTVVDYLKLIDRFRKASPDMAFSSDFIVGYPGETDQDFRATLALINAVGFSQAYSFIYSQRPGTPASALDGQIAEDMKAERLALLQDCMKQHQLSFNQKFQGHYLPVLIEKKGRHPGQLIGRSPYLQSVYFEGDDSLLGKMVTVHVQEGHLNSLAGKIAMDGVSVL